MALCLLFLSARGYVVLVSRSNAQWLTLFATFPVFLYGLYFIGFRPFDAGLDTPLYIRTFEQLQGLATAHEIGVIWYGNSELFWWPVQSLLKYFFDTRGWIVVNYLLVYGSVFLAYKRLCAPYGISAFIFPFVFLTYFFVYAGNTIRQALALPIGLIGFSLYFEGRRLLWLILTGCAIGLHWSCVVFLLVPVFSLELFKRRWILISFPLAALLASFFVKEIVASVLSVIGLEALNAREELYFSGARASHIGEVWQTLNFWVCVCSAFAFLMFSPLRKTQTNVIERYAVLFLSLVLFGIPVADFSERYLPALLMILPLMIGVSIGAMPVPHRLKSFLFVAIFLGMAAGVLLNKSAQLTLGF